MVMIEGGYGGKEIIILQGLKFPSVWLRPLLLHDSVIVLLFFVSTPTRIDAPETDNGLRKYSSG